MFGFGKKKSRPPVEITLGVTIETTPDTVYSMLDLASPTNRLKARGIEFTPLAGETVAYKAVDPAMPDITFHIRVEECRPPEQLVIVTRIESETPIGALESSRSVYTITPLDQGGVRVELQETSTLRDGLAWREYKMEEQVLSYAVANDMHRLKEEVEALAGA